ACRCGPRRALLSPNAESAQCGCARPCQSDVHRPVPPLLTGSDYERTLVGYGTCSARAKWRAPRSARITTLKKYLTTPALLETPDYDRDAVVTRSADFVLWATSSNFASKFAINSPQPLLWQTLAWGSYVSLDRLG